MVRKLIAFVLAVAAVGLGVATFEFDAFGVASALKITSGSQTASVTTQVVPRALSLVCPGAGYVEAASHGGAARFSQQGAAQVSVNQNSSSGFMTATQPTVIEVSGDKAGERQGSALLSANQTQQFNASANSLSAGANGFIGADCVRPSSDFWFLGASTAVGRQALLIVHNPSKVDATFDLQLFDESGLVNASGMQGLSVIAGKTLVLPLAAFAPSDPTLAVHLSSQGGAVAAWIQQKTVRGTVAAGIDFISPSSAASELQVIPGLAVSASKAAIEIAKSNPDYGDLAPVVRLFAPAVSARGAKTVNATILVSGIDAKTFGTVVSQEVVVGQTIDVNLPGLADGKYSVEVKADRPIFASMRLSRNSADPAKVLTSSGSDFTWISAAEAITTMRNFMVPGDGLSTLNIANESTSPTTVTVKDITHGKTKTYVLAESGVASSATHPGDNLQISASSPVYANVTTASDAGIASLKILDAKNLGGKVSVTLH